MADVADGLVVQLADLAGERIAQRAQAAAGVERLVAHAVEREVLEPFERQQLDPPAVVDRFARIAVFVDQAVGGPGEIVLQLAGGKLRQRADAHLHRFDALEPVDQVVGDDRDETRRQAALRHEDLPVGGALGDFADEVARGDVLGQIEVTGARLERRLGDERVVMKAQRRDDRLRTLHRGRELVGIGGVDAPRFRAGELRDALQRRVVDVADDELVIARVHQESGRSCGRSCRRQEAIRDAS